MKLVTRLALMYIAWVIPVCANAATQPPLRPCASIIWVDNVANRELADLVQYSSARNLTRKRALWKSVASLENLQSNAQPGAPPCSVTTTSRSFLASTIFETLDAERGELPLTKGLIAVALNSLALATDANARSDAGGYVPTLAPYRTIPGFNSDFFRHIAVTLRRLAVRAGLPLADVRDTPDDLGRWISTRQAEFLRYWT